MPREFHLDPATLDLNKVIVDQAGIRQVNPQRFEMEQLTAIVLTDPDQHIIAGYKDVGKDEFWVRGHLPDYPLFPGVLMCEAAAQLCSYYITTHGHGRGDFIGFGGLENVRFRGQVRPGDRLLLVAKATKLHRRQTIFSVQGFVGSKLVFNGDVIGVPLNREEGA
jgi:3-hydroxyacyl-[acyl-carrier-protein] dehydratase